MLDLVGNPDDRFSRVTAHFIKMLIYILSNICIIFGISHTIDVIQAIPLIFSSHIVGVIHVLCSVLCFSWLVKSYIRYYSNHSININAFHQENMSV